MHLSRFCACNSMIGLKSALMTSIQGRSDLTLLTVFTPNANE